MNAVIAALNQKLGSSFREAGTYTVGMPQLSYGGLSENWLLKECGDRHWAALARAFDMPSPAFRDTDGNRLYAAFLGYRTRRLCEGAVEENDTISIGTSLARSSKTQYHSTHLVRCQGHEMMSVELLSTFLRRNVAGSNRSVERREPNHTTAMSVSTVKSRLADDARMMRAGSWLVHMGFENSRAFPQAKLEFRPCPSTDFNGANFLYFASFQALADRAEWDWDLSGSSVSRTVNRDIFYYGNIDVGERIRIVLQASTPNGDKSALQTWIRFFRLADSKLIADCFSAKALQPFKTQNAFYEYGADR